MGIAFGPRCPLYLFFLKKDAAAIANAARPCRSGLLSRTKPQPAQQAPACRLPTAPAKSVRTAALYQPILRAHRQAGPCFFPFIQG